MKKPVSLTAEEMAGVEIQRLPPGAAIGARDLHRWSMNRAVGRSGTGSARVKAATYECLSCGHRNQVIVSAASRQKRIKSYCRECGSPYLRRVKARA